MGTLGDNLEFIYGDRMKGLPPGYRRVEYLESTGVQWIDTGVSPAPNQEFELDGYWTNTTHYNNCWGAKNTSYASAIEGFILLSQDTNKGIFFNYRSYEMASGFSRNLSQSRHRFVSHLYTGDQWLSVDGVKGTVYMDNGAFPDFGNLTYYAFARNQSGTANYFGNIRAYSMIFRTEGVPVRNYVPCVRISDNKPGLYDLCGSICPMTSTSFYVNAGTGDDFLLGELS